SWVLRRLPLRGVFTEIEGGLVLYRDRPGALAFALAAAVIGQSACCLIYFGFGRSIGVESLRLADYFVLVTVLSLIKGVSPTPGSAGFAEGVIALVVEPLGLDVTHVVLLSLLMTGAMFVWGWPGAALVAAGRRGGGAR
ncbi:MAG: flippase-like domain-containing protein, partial [Planctomycetes bacterium]|nr:flippase-like domain-containing protein [Planctomycetota bacterium]